MKPPLLAGIAAALASLLFASCASPAARFADPSMPIEVLQGQRFEIALEANPTTGYSWALAKRLENRVITLATTRYFPNETSRVGSGGTEVWSFQARHEGTAAIVLAYRRPWEPEPGPSTNRVFRVTVRKR